MAERMFASALAMALIFMLYVLANFYFEAKRPRRHAPRHHKHVIAFRTTSRGPRARAAASHMRQPASSTEDIETAKEDPSPVVLPIGVRRLAAKRAARS